MRSEPASSAPATPIVKWAGGKTKLLTELLARMPAQFERYYEPFAGGAALFFRVARVFSVLGDSNADLMACYRALASDADGVLRELHAHAERHSEGHYCAVRSAFNAGQQRGSVMRAAAFIYLNKACFNGLWRVNGLGEFNVAWGKHATFAPDVDNLRAAAAALARAELRTGSYVETVRDAQDGDFVYVDPPYDGTFTSYTAGKFGDADQAEVAFTVRKLVERGCKIMVSSPDTPRIRALYAGMRIDTVKCGRAINCNGKGRGAVDEVIVMAGYEPSGVTNG